MAWLKLHQTLPQNKKTLILRDQLGIKTPQAVGHLCMLWLWALDNAGDGDLSIFTDDIIAEVSGWAGKGKDVKKYVNALRTAGFLDENNTIHDWADYTGKLIEKRKTEAVRQKNIREKNKNNTQYVRSTEDVRNEDDTQYESCTEYVCTENVPPLKSRVDKSRVDNNIDITDVISLSPDGNAPEETTRIRYQEIADLYNSICSGCLPKCTKMSEARKAAIRARLNSGYNIADIELVFKKAAESPFLRGGNKQNWHADFDWLLNDANMAKVLDGKYDSETAIGIENKKDEKGDF